MKNTFGNSVAITLFGESHGKVIGAVLDGIAPGIKIDEKRVEEALAKRRPKGNISTSRSEKDRFEIVSGIFNGYTTGTPVCIVIKNEDVDDSVYEEMDGRVRPSHADYTAHIKYNGFEDYRGGGHFSGRLTAAIVAAGAVAQAELDAVNIKIGTHLKKCAGVSDRPFENVEDDINVLSSQDFPALDKDAGEKMKNQIEKASKEMDSVGGVTETAILNIPCGVGEPFFDSVESAISHAMFSIPAVKGVGGNTVLVIEHNLNVIKSADWIIDLGPEGGEGGGTLIAQGTPEDVAKIPQSYTGQYLAKWLGK